MSSLRILALTLSLASLQFALPRAAKIARVGQSHYFIEFNHSCFNSKRAGYFRNIESDGAFDSWMGVGQELQDFYETEEAYGCNYMDFYRGEKLGQLYSEFQPPLRNASEKSLWVGRDYFGDIDQAHWNMDHAEEECRASKRKKVPACGVTYATIKNRYGRTAKKREEHDYIIPDKCARGMASELSTVYNQKDRTFVQGWNFASKMGGLMNALAQYLDTWDANCTEFGEDMVDITGFARTETNVLQDRLLKSATCWTYVADWRHLYCTKYKKCKCETGDDTNCHRNTAKLECCDQRYEEFKATETFKTAMKSSLAELVSSPINLRGFRS